MSTNFKEDISGCCRKSKFRRLSNNFSYFTFFPSNMLKFHHSTEFTTISIKLKASTLTHPSPSTSYANVMLVKLVNYLLSRGRTEFTACHVEGNDEYDFFQRMGLQSCVTLFACTDDKCQTYQTPFSHLS